MLPTADPVSTTEDRKAAATLSTAPSLLVSGSTLTPITLCTLQKWGQRLVGGTKLGTPVDLTKRLSMTKVMGGGQRPKMCV